MSVTSSELQTPLHAWHVAHGGRMVEFAGWSMPVQYESIVKEHQATRGGVGLFDVSHMGRFFFANAEAAGPALSGLTTRRVFPLKAGRIRYSLMTNESGGILDDVLVYHLQPGQGEPYYFMVVNASNRTKILHWLEAHVDLPALGFEDRTTATAMIAVQGPGALDAVAPLCAAPPSSLAYYTGMMTDVSGTQAIVSRTGYTGEDGCELIVPADRATEIWDAVLQSAGPAGCAVGLGARDSLRLEAAMPLYGHELSETINPAQAGVGFAINLKDREFVGRDAIVAAKQDGTLPLRVGLQVHGRRPAREHCPLYDGQRRIGEVTSGVFSPTLQRPIAMGYVEPAFAEIGTAVEVDIRGKRQSATICPMPFYQR